MSIRNPKLAIVGVVIILIGLALIIFDKVTETPQAPIESSPEVLTPPDKTIDPIEPTEIISAQSVTIPGLEIGMESGAAENLIERLMKPETSEGNQTYNLRLTPQTPNGYTLIAVADDMLDDSVKAQEITAIFKPGSGPGFVLSEYTVRVKCYRGGNIDSWQAKACS